MTPSWEAVAARVAGLSVHLMTEDRIRAVRVAANVEEWLATVADSPYAEFLPRRLTSVDEAEAALVRSTTVRLEALARWTDPVALAPVWLEHDMRNVRALLRGHAGALPHDQRLAAALPTPTLSTKLLQVLANAESPASMAATLTVWGHPLGSSLLAEAHGAATDLFRMEVALMRGFAEGSATLAKRADPGMRDFVAETIDAHNVLAALLLAGARFERDAGRHFVEGGRTLSRDDFLAAVGTGERVRCAALLARATKGSVFSAPLSDPPPTPGATATRILLARVTRLAWDRRSDPLSPAPVLLFLFKLRREGQALRQGLWSAALRQRRHP